MTRKSLEKTTFGVALSGSPNLGDRFWGALRRVRWPRSGALASATAADSPNLGEPVRETIGDLPKSGPRRQASRVEG